MNVSTSCLVFGAFVFFPFIGGLRVYASNSEPTVTNGGPAVAEEIVARGREVGKRWIDSSYVEGDAVLQGLDRIYGVLVALSINVVDDDLKRELHDRLELELRQSGIELGGDNDYELLTLSVSGTKPSANGTTAYSVTLSLRELAFVERYGSGKPFKADVTTWTSTQFGFCSHETLVAVLKDSTQSLATEFCNTYLKQKQKAKTAGNSSQ